MFKLDLIFKIHICVFNEIKVLRFGWDEHKLDQTNMKTIIKNLFTQQQDKVITKNVNMGGYKIGIIPELIYNLNEMVIFINKIMKSCLHVKAPSKVH
jgi:hypothetical protein